MPYKFGLVLVGHFLLKIQISSKDKYRFLKMLCECFDTLFGLKTIRIAAFHQLAVIFDRAVSYD